MQAQSTPIRPERRRKALGRAFKGNEQQLSMPFVQPRTAMKISYVACEQASIPKQRAELAKNPFAPYQPAKGVIPEGRSMAMDDAGDMARGWAYGSLASASYAEGQMFLGYPELALLAQRPEYRLIVETIATEMTRKWIKIRAKGDGDDKAEKIAKLEDEFERLKVRDTFRESAVHDGFYGRGHIYLDTGDSDNPNELATDLGDGRNDASAAKVGLWRPLRSIRTVEPVWTYPTQFNSTDPLKSDWYRPSSWYAMGKQIHRSRLLTFIGREVPDLLKPAYSFGGLSLTQMAKPYVDNWLTTRQSVQDIIKSFTVFVIKTNMMSVLNGGGGDDFFKRLDIFNATRDNRGLLAVDKNDEDFANVSAPLSSLDHLQAQAQEHIASVSRIPLVKLTGISPSGLNASSDGELRCWGDLIHSEQESLFRPNLNTILWFVQLSLFGEIDPDITYDFLPIYELTEKEKAELRQIEATTGQILIDTGALDPREERARVAHDADTPYAGLDVLDMPEPPVPEEGDGLFPGAQETHDEESRSEMISRLFGNEIQAHDESIACDCNAHLTARERTAIARLPELESKEAAGTISRGEKGLLTTARRVQALAA